MNCRILFLRSKTLARASRPRTTAAAAIHTSSAQSKLFAEHLKQLIQSDPQTEPKPEAAAQPGTKSKMTISQRQGGVTRGPGMHLYVPIKARNVEKAWEIWSTQLCTSESGAALKELVDLVVLLVHTSEVPQTAGLFGNDNADASSIVDQRRRSAGFRIATILRRIFANSVGSEGDVSAWGLLEAAEYEGILGLLVVGQGPDAVVSGNSACAQPEDIEDAPVGRLAHLVLLAAIRDGLQITPAMASLALQTAIFTKDTAAARDILQLFNADLAMLIDPTLANNSRGQSQIGHTIADAPQSIVEMVLEAISVGQNPAEVDLHATASQEEADGQLDDLSSLNKEAPFEDAALAAVCQWRVDTAERVYRAFVSAGMAEVSAPDGSKRPALQGSDMPSAHMLATLLRIHSEAGSIDHSIILYDTLVATLEQQKPVEGLEPASGCEEITSEHKADARLWTCVLDAVCETQQLWLATRVLGDMAADGWAPTESMYTRCLDTMEDTSDEALVLAVAAIRAATPTVSADSLVRALVRPNSPNMAARIEQALLVSELPTTDAEDKSVVSDDTARAIVAALISNAQIARARHLGEIWTTTRPDLITSQSITDLVLALGQSGDYTQALELFARVQEAAAEDISADILGAVLRVYVLAGDYDEAVSVSKRIRAMVREPTVPQQAKPTHVVYNSMIRAYCEANQITEAMRVLEEMRGCGLHATSETYTILVQTMSSLRSYDGLKLIVALADVDYNMVPLDNTSPEMASALPLSTDYYNGLIEAYGRVAEPIKAFQVWELMRQRAVAPNNLTATLLIDTCAWNERVHWDEDMEPDAPFVERNVPEDQVYTGMPFFHMHYLANALEQLQQAGLVFSLANHRHLLEALVRAGFLEDAMDMLLGEHEDPATREGCMVDARELLKPTGEVFFAGLFSLIKQAKGEEDDGKRGMATFMDDFSLRIPLCRSTVDTMYGTIAAVRSQCLLGDNIEPADMPFVQRASPNLLKRLDLHEQRLTEFLRTQQPELLPASQS
ncbi:hypothetical protein BX661DRAFT_176911 [Kickxella alabastrina]|uniref:uncharacterized protein n=1 Tax=Kickxella alabastrina TaxID=61397 RepID=UPI0022212297|nr:uncharacterized protein BX661DRAFT_176911 [Kickxella alabastrina]KAI7834281.1 hypothetical protein BX661DRAFT_176911 [Kickxella alabastrina]